MKYAEIDSKGNFTGTVYEKINDAIITDRAKYGNTLVAIDDTKQITNASISESATADYGKPTAEELARPVLTLEQEIELLKSRVDQLEKIK